LAVGIVLWSILGGSAEASRPPTARPAARQRDRPRRAADHLAAFLRELKRARPRGIRTPDRAAAAPDVAFVTITTATKGTSFYVDSRRVGVGSKVHQSLAPGYHRFQAVHPSGARWQKYLSFDAGDDRQLIIHW
jgi:hypothetical protein